MARIETDDKGKRDSIKELNKLLTNIDPATRGVIREQILKRVHSLVGYGYEMYMNKKQEAASRPRRSPLTALGFWAKGAWALVRGREAMQSFVVDQVDKWIDKNILL